MSPRYIQTQIDGLPQREITTTAHDLFTTDDMAMAAEFILRTLRRRRGGFMISVGAFVHYHRLILETKTNFHIMYHPSRLNSKSYLSKYNEIEIVADDDDDVLRVVYICAYVCARVYVYITLCVVYAVSVCVSPGNATILWAGETTLVVPHKFTARQHTYRLRRWWCGDKNVLRRGRGGTEPSRTHTRATRLPVYACTQPKSNIIKT